jgi:hypothetical protein
MEIVKSLINRTLFNLNFEHLCDFNFVRLNHENITFKFSHVCCDYFFYNLENSY